MYLVSFGARGGCHEEMKLSIKLPSELKMTTKLCELMKSVTVSFFDTHNHNNPTIILDWDSVALTRTQQESAAM